jgi:small subunit ribosomal protein S35
MRAASLCSVWDVSLVPVRGNKFIMSLAQDKRRTTRADSKVMDPANAFPIQAGRVAAAPREQVMHTDQDWPSVWPTAQSFRASVVPLPIRMGLPIKGGVALSKYGNVELLKLTNFLHLTPPAIGRHCDAIKRFMTSWPSQLSDADHITQHFPVSITTSTFCFSGPVVKHPEARVVTLTVKLASLNLDEAAQEKFKTLVGKRYEAATDTLTLVTDRCPTAKQNTDYALYLLSVLVQESKVVQSFELDKPPNEGSPAAWEEGLARVNIARYLDVEPDQLGEKPEVTKVFEASQICENPIEGVEEYKKATVELLGLRSFEPDSVLE